MITTSDITRIKSITETSSSIGEKTNVVISKVVRFVSSKVFLLIAGVLLSICFFVLGLLGRKK
jgi:hypothetical protein